MFQRFFVRETVVSEDNVADMNPEVVSGSGDIFYRAARWCLMALAALLPVWFLPITLAPVFINKAFLVSLLTILAVLCYIIHAILKGKIEIPLHWIFGIMAIVLAAWTVSAMTSPQTLMSILGATGSEGASVLSLFLFLVMAFMVATVFPDRASQLKLLMASGFGFLVFLVSMIFFWMGWGSIFGSGFDNQTFNTIGSWRSVALALGFYTMLLYPFLLTAHGKLRWYLAVIFVANLIAIMMVNFPLAWAIIGFFAVLFLSYSIWQRSVSATALTVSIVLLLASLFGFFSQNALMSILKLPSPVEVNVSHRATFDISKKVLADHLLFGSGPTTFMYSWDSLKPAEVNQTAFWNTRFTLGSSYLVTMLSEVGLVGFLSFVLLLASVWYLGLRNVTTAESSDHLFALSSFLLTSYTIIMWALYPVSFTLIALGFVALGFSLATLRETGRIRTYEIVLFREGPRGFISSLCLVFLMIAGAAGLYLVSARYIGQIVYARGISAFNNEGNLDVAESRIMRANDFDKNNAIYLRSLAQISLLRARSLVQGNVNTKDLLGSQFKSILDNAVRLDQESIALTPLDFESYQSLGKTYEFLIPLGVDGASAAAVAQYQKALQYAPLNPVLWHDQAAAYIAEALRTRNGAALKQAEEALSKAIELKPDYTDAHFLLAQVFDAEGNVPEAIRRAEAAAILAPNDIGSLFQLGLLYYKSNRLSDAEQVFNAAIANNANYSNARYFLGLIYDRAGRRDAAIDQFSKIEDLNPGNQEVETILANLRAGRSALTTITSQPDKRAEPPVSDTASKPVAKKKR